MTEGGSEVLWLASGLNKNVTGIERFALSLLDNLIDEQILSATDVTIACDWDARWLDDVTHQVSVSRVQNPPWRASKRAGRPVVIHNFGHAIFPSAGDASLLLTVCDWGPFTDRSMPVRARASWMQSLVRAGQRADVVHYLNPRLADTRPRLFPRPRSSFFSYPDTSGVVPRVAFDEEAASLPALFVGTAENRKRIPLIAAFAETRQQRVTLVGDGTDHWNSAFVAGRGRVSDAELEAAYSNSSALIMVSSYEGFGLPVLEAARRGLYSVVSPEVFSTLPVDLQEFCVQVDPHDPADFARGLAVATSRRAGAHFIGNLLDPLLDSYRELVGRT